jgi:hypothetical protein
VLEPLHTGLVPALIPVAAIDDGFMVTATEAQVEGDGHAPLLSALT